MPTPPSSLPESIVDSLLAQSWRPLGTRVPFTLPNAEEIRIPATYEIQPSVPVDDTFRIHVTLTIDQKEIDAALEQIRENWSALPEDLRQQIEDRVEEEAERFLGELRERIERGTL